MNIRDFGTKYAAKYSKRVDKLRSIYWKSTKAITVHFIIDNYPKLFAELIVGTA